VNPVVAIRANQATNCAFGALLPRSLLFLSILDDLNPELT